MVSKMGNIINNLKKNKYKDSILFKFIPVVIIGIIIVYFVLFNMLFKKYETVIMIENNGYMLEGTANIENIKNKDNKDNNINTVEVKEYNYIYKNALNNYVDNSLKKTININYPLFINEGLSIVNYNDNTNLIDTNLNRLESLSNIVLSYGSLYNLNDFSLVDQEKYLLLSYENGIYINLYDLNIKTETSNYAIPTNSFLYFLDDSIYYYERKDNKFYKKQITDIDFSSLLSFEFKSDNELYEYTYEDFLIGIGSLFKSEKIIIPDIKIDETNQIEKEVEDFIVDEEIISHVSEPEFVWIKPSVSAGNLKANVYSLTGNLQIKDPAGVITKPPTFIITTKGKTYSRRAFYSGGDFSINGLLASTEFQIIGQYTYLDEDLETKKIVTFYSDSFTTLSLDELEDIDIKFENGDIYSKKIEIKNLGITSSLEAEALKGIRNVGFVINGDKYYFSKSNVNNLLRGKTLEKLATAESLNTNTEYDFEINFYDNAGNKLRVNNNKSHTRTSKKIPSAILKLTKNEVDYLILSLNLRNEDNVELNNYRYIVTNTSGKTVAEDKIESDQIKLTNMDPNQIFNITIKADFDLNDNKGINKDVTIGEMEFTSLPISSLGLLIFNLEITDITDSMASISSKIDTLKTDERLLKLLKELHIALYKMDTDELVQEYNLFDSDVNALKNHKSLDFNFNNIDSNTKYIIKIDSVVMQGETKYNLECLHDLNFIETHKKSAKVQVANSFTTSNMIDLDVKVVDIDNSILSSGLRLELRDITNNLIDSRIIDINKDYVRITYDNLKMNENYIINFIADEYNETNNNSTFKAKYELLKLNRYTSEGISGNIKLNSFLRFAKGNNLVDMYSETKWIQTYNTYTIPKQYDEEGNMRIYSKNGASNYMYDLSEYHDQIVTATFKVKIITPLNTGFKLFFNNYLGNTTNASYGIELTNLSTTKWTSFSYTFKVGSNKSGTDYNLNTEKYYGKYRCDFAGFYFTNGTTNLAEYAIKDFEIHLTQDMKDVNIESNHMEQGTYNSNGSKNNTASTFNLRARLAEPVMLEGGNYYSFDFNTLDYAYIYLTNMSNKNIKTYSWFKTGKTIYVPDDCKLYIAFRLGDGLTVIDPTSVGLSIFKYSSRPEIPYEPFNYDCITKVKVNLIDSRNEIANDTYYIQVMDNNNNELYVNEYKELENTDKILDEIKEIKLEENKQYMVNLLIKIRDRYYTLDTFSITTDSEVKGISTTNDWAYMQPNGNYIVLNDIDFKDFTFQSLGWGYKYFYGTIDFQGYSANLYTNNTYFQRLGRIEKSGVLKNMVLNVHLVNEINNNSIRGFVSSNYGTIENIQVKVFDERETKYNDTYVNMIADVNQSSGVIQNFTLKLETDINLYSEVGLITRYNYGIVRNGYVYGADAIIANENVNATVRTVGLVQRYGGVQSSVSNIYILSSMKFPNDFSYDKTGLLAYETYGEVKNVYTVGKASTKSQDVGPIVGYVRSTASFTNNYYMNDYVYTTPNQIKITPLNLNDVTFQESVLGKQFNVSEMIKLGYYPQVTFSSNKMPKQEYLALPAYEEDLLIDIITMEVKEKSNDRGIINFVIYNPNGDSIENIAISDLKTRIVSQVFEDGKSYIELEVYEPETYVSRYAIRSVSAKSYSGIISTKNYDIGEKYLFIDFYREINNIDDWIGINTKLNQNYIINTDLDFKTYANYYINNFSGKINGQNHVLKNISIVGNKNGLFNQMNGTLENIYFENVYKTSDSTNSGLIGYSNQYAKLTNVHVKNVNIEVPSTRTADTLYAGGLIGSVYYSKLTNCSVTDVNITSEVSIIDVHAGGMAGYSNGGAYNNVYAQNVNIVVKNSINTLGVGGLVGREVSSVATIYNAYSTGYIENNGYRTGGIVGATEGYIENSYSSVDLISDIDTLGGIAGYAGHRDYLKNNLFVGSIYAKNIGAVIGRIVANGSVDETNYALKTGLVNGVVSDLNNGESFITLDEIRDVNTFTSDLGINLGSSYDYSKVNELILPKLYYLDDNKLLPNQRDNKVFVDEFEITNIITEKHANDVTITLYISNPNHLLVDEVLIEGMNVEIVKNNNVGNETVVELNATPTKYYDTYKLYKINCHKETGETISFKKTVRLNMLFYKNLSSFEDWQKISTTDPENYLLVNDIDFTGKNFNTGVVFNRLETNSESTFYTLSGMNYNVTKAGNMKGIITRVVASLKNIKFDNIKIESEQTTKNNYYNLITYNFGVMKNLSFTNINIITPNKHRAAIVGQLLTKEVDNITLDNIKVDGNSYVAAFAAYYENSSIKEITNIKASNLDVYGRANYVGGLFTNFSTAVTEQIKQVRNIELTDSVISGPDSQYVGGIAAYGSANDVIIRNVRVDGSQNVGGAFGYSYDNYSYNIQVYDSDISGTYRYIGGIAGSSRYLYDCLVDNSKITGKNAGTSAVGGLLGTLSYTIYRSVIRNSEVVNSGINTGGIIGLLSGGGVSTTSAHNVKITGYNNTGGVIGNLSSGTISSSRVTESIVNSENQYAGGLVGFFDNINNLSTFREGAMRQSIIARTNVSANEYAGGLIGGKNVALYNPQNTYELYFEGNVSTIDGETAGIAAGDSSNEEIINLGRIGFYEKSLVNGQNIDDITERETLANLYEERTSGYIDDTTGNIVINYSYSNASYSNLIELKKGSTYKIQVKSSNKAAIDLFRVKLYDSNQVYQVTLGYNTKTWNYFGNYFSLANLDSINLTPIRNCYIRLQLLYDYIEDISVTELESNSELLKSKLLSASDLRNRITWNRYLSSDKQDFYYKTYFGLDENYWDFTPLNNEVSNLEISDNSGNNHLGNANVTVIQKDGLFFDGKDDYVEVNNYSPSSEITISATINSFSSRGSQYIFSSRNSSTNNGVGLMISGRTIHAMINGSTYSSSYAIPYYKEYNVAMTYSNNKILKMYLNGELIYTKENVNKTISVMPDAKTYVANDSIYNTTNKYIGLIKNVYVFNRALSDTEIKNNYQSAGLSNTNGAEIIYDFTNMKYTNIGYYPFFKWNTPDIPVNWQEYVELPKVQNGLFGSARPLGKKLLSTSRKLGNFIFNGLLENNYHIYSSGINTINIEFDKISSDMEFTYKINDKIVNTKVEKRVYTLYYDYSSDIEFTIKNLSEEKNIKLTKESLAKTISIYNNKYYYIKDNNLYENDKLLINNVNHIYNNLVLTNNRVYNVENHEYQNIYSNSILLTNEIPIYQSIINNNIVNSFYNFSEVIDTDGNTVIRDEQIVLKDNRVYMYTPSDTIKNNTIIFNNFNNSEYQIALGNDNKLYSYKNEMKINGIFINKDIEEINYDFNSNEPLLIIKYKNNNVVVYNYYTGEKIFEAGKSYTPSLFEFISLSLKPNNIILNNKTYDDVKELKSIINNISDQNIIDILDNNNDKKEDIQENESLIEDNKNDYQIVNDDIIDNYLITYNNDTNSYELYNVNDLLNTSNENILNVEYKIKSNVFLYNYFHSNNKVDEKIKNNKLLIIILIIMVVIINLIILILNLRKKVLVYDK